MPTDLLSTRFPSVRDGQWSSDYPTVASRAPHRGTEVVLLVDDEPAPRRLGRHVLQSFGYTVLEAECTDEAVRVAAAHPGPIDLLVTDIVMPGECGRTLAAVLTARRPGMRVLFVSSYGEDAGTPQGTRRLGQFLAKPFSFSDLAVKVRQVLDAG
ncbi:MAG TPA: response regulator [Gemmataceae bacterium]|nr:response regulator [Gemmataceae bacterium]